MELADAIHNRRAVRDYLPTPVNDQAIQRLIDAAIWALSAMNRQPWGFLVVRNRDVLDHAAAEAKHLLLKHMPADSPFARYRNILNDPAFHLFYNAPALIVVHTTIADSMPGLSSAEDCCLAAQNLMLAAHAFGLGTCWIGFARSWLAQTATKEMFGVPSSWSPVAPVIIGEPRVLPDPVERRTPPILWHPARGEHLKPD